MTPHFNLEEFTFSNTAIRLGIDNTPTEKDKENLLSLAEALEKVREVLGNNPIKISSGYRSLELNRAVKSRDTSYHTRGLAVDFTCPRYGSVPNVMRAIAESEIEFDQLILEFDSWIHLGFAEKDIKPRKQKLVINKQGVSLYKG